VREARVDEVVGGGQAAGEREVESEVGARQAAGNEEVARHDDDGRVRAEVCLVEDGHGARGRQEGGGGHQLIPLVLGHGRRAHRRDQEEEYNPNSHRGGEDE
jgi:hypothetical protein